MTRIKLLPYFFLAIYSSALQSNLSECLSSGLSSEINFGRAAYFTINSDTNLESLSKIYTHLKEVTNNNLIKNLEARRLINQDDWQRVQFQNEPWKAYGDKTIKDWFRGREYILSLPKNQRLDGNLLKKIHEVVAKNHKFHGFEGRRLLEKLRSRKISQEEFDNLKKRAYENNEEVSGVSHFSLVGVFRQNPIDQIIHKGSSFQKDGSRYFTGDELEMFKKNKYVTIDEKSIKKIGPNAYTATAFYQNVDKVEKSIENIFKIYNKKLENAKNTHDIVKTVVMMEKDLISVHPFLDGNGRTIRLLGDHILNKYNLPPSLYPNESDLTMSLNEAVNFRIQGMKDYLKEHQKYMKKEQ